MKFKKPNLRHLKLTKVVSFATIVALSNRVTLLIKLSRILLKWNTFKVELCRFDLREAKAKLFRQKRVSSQLPEPVAKIWAKPKSR